MSYHRFYIILTDKSDAAATESISDVVTTSEIKVEKKTPKAVQPPQTRTSDQPSRKPQITKLTKQPCAAAAAKPVRKSNISKHTYR